MGDEVSRDAQGVGIDEIAFPMPHTNILDG